MANWTNTDTRQRVYLIGFMGSGKTTRGKELASLWKYTFIDLDERIAQEAGMSIPDIFKHHGEAAFRNREATMLKKTALLGRSIIATGGGTPAIPGAMDWMNQHGWTVYLKESEDVLLQRLEKGRTERPMLHENDWMNKARELFSYRERFYLQARQILLPETFIL
jgi:shikimate kinase